VALEPERAVGGRIRAGDTVGVVLSFEPFDVQDGVTGEQAEQTPNTSHLAFHKVTVTSVQFDPDDGEAPSVGPDDDSSDGDGDDEDGDEEQVSRAPSDRLLVTLAVRSPQVEQIVFAAEFGTIWLTAENAAADESGTREVTRGDVYGAPPS
jgi:pilus assembly protein CpaB